MTYLFKAAPCILGVYLGKYVLGQVRLKYVLRDACWGRTSPSILEVFWKGVRIFLLIQECLKYAWRRLGEVPTWSSKLEVRPWPC